MLDFLIGDQEAREQCIMTVVCGTSVSGLTNDWTCCLTGRRCRGGLGRGVSGGIKPVVGGGVVVVVVLKSGAGGRPRAVSAGSSGNSIGGLISAQSPQINGASKTPMKSLGEISIVPLTTEWLQRQDNASVLI